MKAVKQANQAKAKELAREAGAAVNGESARSIFWFVEPRPEFAWRVMLHVPFSYAASKNHLYTARATGHVALRREARAMRDGLTAAVAKSLEGVNVVHNKLWLDILVQKPNHRGDAVNVVDLVCDAVKRAVPVDDRWFCIARVDWEIVKESPRLYVGLAQEAVENAQVCSSCGLIKPWTDFGKKVSNLHGVERVCKGCRAAGRALARTRKAEAEQ